jgi:hypothetical protein
MTSVPALKRGADAKPNASTANPMTANFLLITSVVRAIEPATRREVAEEAAG